MYQATPAYVIPACFWPQNKKLDSSFRWNDSIGCVESPEILTRPYSSGYGVGAINQQVQHHAGRTEVTGELDGHTR